MPQDKKLKFVPFGQPTTPIPTPAPNKPVFTPFVPADVQPPDAQPVEGYGGGLYNVASEIAAPFVKPVLSTVSPVIDFLSRGQYASAKFFDSSADVSKGVWQNLKEAWAEAVDPKERLSFSDVIKKRAPKFAVESPNATALLGFLGDVALDPTTYIGVGLVKEGLQIGGKTLTKAGIKGLQLAEEIGGKTRFVERKLAENVNLVKVLGMADDYPAQKAYYLQELGFTDEVARRAQEIDKISGGKLGIDKSSKIAEQELVKEVRRDYYSNTTELGDPIKNSKVQEVMYHGTSSPNNFKQPKGMSWFTSEREFANEYAGGVHIGGAEGSQRVFPTRLNIRNPYKVKDRLEQIEKVNDPDFISELKQKGYDGILRVDENGRKVALPFYDDQILSTFEKQSWQSKVATDLSTGEVREKAEQRIMRIADALPEFKSFEKSGLRLTANIPFVATKDIPGSAKFFDLIGVNYLGQNISQLASHIPGRKFAGEVFNKNAGADQVPQEFVEHLRDIENKKDSLIQGVMRDVQTIGQKVNTEGRTKIQNVMYKIDDQSRILEEKLGRGLTQGEADKIKMEGLQGARFTPEEHALVASLYQGYAEMGELEMRTKLLRSSLANYTHREYEVIKDSTQAGNVLRPPSAQGTNTFLGSSQARDYVTMSEARAAGKVPEMDALVVYAQRLIKHRDKMANAQFNEATRHAFGLDVSDYGKQITNDEFKTLPRFAQNSIKMLGDSVYPSGMNETVKDFLKVVDTATGWWKKGAYAIKPSSAPKQLIGNTVLSAMVAGARTFKAFDPRALMDASLAVFSKIIPEKATPDLIKKMVANGFGGDAEFAERVALRNFRNSNDLNNYFANWNAKSVLGTHLNGTEEYKFMLDGGVIKGFDASGESLKIKVNNVLKRNPDSIGTVAGELAKVWNWPSMAEDFSRASLYINARRMGYSSTEAVKLVNKGLFDYARGLSYVEKNVFKRIIPFYTFPRFGIPAVLKNVITKPGQAVTANKVVNLMEKLFAGESLTPAEQETFGSSFVVEQPRVYTGFDKEGKAGFNIFNSLTPFDVLSLVVRKKDGGIDYNRTAEKSVLAAMTPFLKVPAELLIRNDKGERGFNFFTGRTLDNAGKLGKLDSDSKLNTILPSFVKDAIGWEIRRDPVSGETKAYVNPYLAHTVGSAVPGVKSWINLGDGSKSGLERSMEFILGIQKVKLDLKAQSEWNALKDNKEVSDLKAKIKLAQLKGSQNEFEKAFKEYNDFIKAIEVKQGLTGQDQIRGQGMNPEQPQGTGTTQTFK